MSTVNVIIASEITLLFFFCIYLYFRITYVRNQWTDLMDSMVKNFYEFKNETIDAMGGTMSPKPDAIKVKQWCIEQAMRNQGKDTISLAENIEGYILKKEQSDKNMFDADSDQKILNKIIDQINK